MSTVKVVLKTSNKNKEGKSPIKLRIYKDQDFKEITLPKCKVYESKWDQENLRVIDDKMMTMRVHNEVEKYKLAIAKLEILDHPYTITSIIKMVKGDKPKPIITEEQTEKKTFVKLIDFVESHFTTNPNLRYGTRKNYNSLVFLLKKMKEKSTIDMIDGGFLREFDTKIRKKYNYSDWTVHTRIKCIKAAIKKAYELKLIDLPRWTGYKMKKGEADRSFLSMDEVKLMRKHNPVRVFDAKVLKAFTFSCFTAMRVGDIQVLTYENFSIETFENGTGIRLKYTMRKNGNIVSAILSQNALSCIDLNKVGKKEIVFGFINYQDLFLDEDTLAQKLESNNAYINTRLKKVHINAGFNRKFTFHEARHTFFCLGIQLGISNNVLKELGGLDSTEVLLKHYAKLVENSKTKAMNKFDEI